MDNQKTYDELNEKLMKSYLNGTMDKTIKEISESAHKTEADLLAVLLQPKAYNSVINIGTNCTECGSPAACEVSCLFDAIKRDEEGKLVITSDCAGCARCTEACEQHILVGRKDVLPVLELLENKETPVYAMIAPAFSGQFSAEVTSGKLRSAFKALGFYGMIEVALFADILTLKEALEFDRYIKKQDDFLLTSCCCPMWVALMRKSYKDLIPHVPPSVSPMVACGRAIKKIHPDAKTVFIGPCIAKKSEARMPDVADSTDYVLTFEEIAQVFRAANINPADLPEDTSDHSSRAGRIYARTAGVSEAVNSTLERLRPGREIPLKAEQADGIIACKELLKNIAEGHINANFIEGMGCVGGCVGGPKSLIDKDLATDHVNDYGDAATYPTPADNQYVLDILHRLGFDTIESLLERDNTFTREF